MNATKKYQNILVIVSGLLVFYLIFKLKWLLWAAVIVGVGASLIPIVATSVDWLWMKLALILGWVNTRILLSIIFYLVLFPIALISRLFSKDPLMLKKQANSAYAVRNHEYKKADLENPW